MYNLNYNAHIENDVETFDEINDKIKISQNENNILELIRKNNEITQPQIREKLKISESTVSRAIKKLKDYGYIIRSGSRKDGHWVVKK